jgi:hypothetical protein
MSGNYFFENGDYNAIFYIPQICDIDRRHYFLFEGRRSEGFCPEKFARFGGVRTRELKYQRPAR